MSLLTVCQDVSKVVALTVPTSVASSTLREHVELLALANEMAERIATGHEWQKLASIATLTGDGTAEDFDLPSDYDRMQADTQIWSSSLSTPLTPILTMNEWVGIEVQSFDFVINAWILYGGQMHIKPAMADGITATFAYQNNTFIADSSGGLKSEFTADNDVFRLDERLLKLGMIWQWRANKGLPYDEDMVNYETALARLVTRDKGAKVLRIGTVRMPSDARTAYPQAITPA